MRDQYAGDINDLLKFALLRALAGSDRTLGVAWYYVDRNDGRADGRHLEWRGEEAWRHLDEALVTTLAALPERTIAALELADIWPSRSLFHREPIPRASLRGEWGNRKRTALADADIVFVDPDNGLGGKSEKHATYEEISGLRKEGRALVFITFPARVKHELQVKELHARLKREAGVSRATTLRISVVVPQKSNPHYNVPRFSWFTLVDGDEILEARARAFAAKLGAVGRTKVTVTQDESNEVC